MNQNKLIKYKFTFQDRVDLVTRMYQDHGYTVDDIVLRLRYPKELVEHIVSKFNLKLGTKKLIA